MTLFTNNYLCIYNTSESLKIFLLGLMTGCFLCVRKGALRLAEYLMAALAGTEHFCVIRSCFDTVPKQEHDMLAVL